MLHDKETHHDQNFGQALSGAAVIGLAIVLPAAPASATVHEIVAQWCSGHDPLEPHGISGGSHADNFAQPLNSKPPPSR